MLDVLVKEVKSGHSISLSVAEEELASGMTIEAIKMLISGKLLARPSITSMKLVLKGLVLADRTVISSLASVPAEGKNSHLALHLVLVDDKAPAAVASLPLFPSSFSFSPTTPTLSPSSSSSSSFSAPSSPFPLPLDRGDLTLDLRSERAALAWMVNSRAQQHALDPRVSLNVIETLSALGGGASTPSPTNDTGAAAPAGVPPPPAAQAHIIPPAEPPLQWLDFRVIARIVIGFVIFVQSWTFNQMCWFGAAGLIYYCCELGIFPSLLKHYLDRRQRRRLEQFQREQARQQQALPPGSPLPEPIPLPQQAPGIADMLLSLSTSGLAVPRAPGFLLDVWSLALALACSLAPNWRP